MATMISSYPRLVTTTVRPTKGGPIFTWVRRWDRAPPTAWISEPDRANTAYGSAFGALGDLNGDGFADVAAGGLEWDSDGRPTGQGLGLPGSAAGLAGTAAWTVEGDQTGVILGAAVGAGDVNGDGTPDLLIGARDYDQTYIDGGAVFVYHGSNHPPVADANGPDTAAEGGSILLDGAGSARPRSRRHPDLCLGPGQ